MLHDQVIDQKFCSVLNNLYEDQAPCQNMPFSVSEFLFIVVLHWLKKIQKQQLTGVF